MVGSAILVVKGNESSHLKRLMKPKLKILFCFPLILSNPYTQDSIPLFTIFSCVYRKQRISGCSLWQPAHRMAISAYPTPADAGVLCIILANTAMYISTVKEIIRSILNVIGIHIASWQQFSVEPFDASDCRRSPSESYMQEFRSWTPVTQYDSIFVCESPEQECSICLTGFEPNAEINGLSCGHIFHKSCLEKWLKHWNTTCPLCRKYMMPPESEEGDCPMLVM